MDRSTSQFRIVPLASALLEPIDEMARAIASAPTSEAVFQAVFVFATRTSPADAVFVVGYDADRGERRCIYAANLSDHADGTRVIEEDRDLGVFPVLPLNDGPQSRAIVANDVVVTADLDLAHGGLPVVETGTDLAEGPARSSLVVPYGGEEGVVGVVEVQSAVRDAFRPEHVAGLRLATALAAIAVRDLEVLSRERAQHEATLRALGIALEYRDLETKGHTDRVVDLAQAFAERLDLGSVERQALRWGAYLHDLGKVAVPDAILLKPGRLTDEEFEQIRDHTRIGEEMVRGIPFLPKGVRSVVRHHHERWDGGGYPDGVAGHAIPRVARMFSLVDVYDALRSARPYKPAWTEAEAVTEIASQAGRQFDPDLVPPFLDLLADRHS